MRVYATGSGRHQKARRLDLLRSELATVEARIESGTVSVCRGGKSLARRRHNLEDAAMSEGGWRAAWEASRWFLTADGDAAYPFDSLLEAQVLVADWTNGYNTYRHSALGMLTPAQYADQ